MPFENNGGCSSVDDADVVIPVAHWGGDVHVANIVTPSRHPTLEEDGKDKRPLSRVTFIKFNEQNLSSNCTYNTLQLHKVLRRVKNFQGIFRYL